MKSFAVMISLVASGCFMDPHDNENVTDVFGHTGSTLRTGSVYIGPDLQLEDQSLIEAVENCDSERYECKIDDVAE